MTDHDRADRSDDELVQATADLFRLMGDATRVRLLYAMLDDGEQRVGTLAEGVGVSESAVSHALRLLRTAKVVESRRDGQAMLYRLDDPHVLALLRITRDHLVEEGVAVKPPGDRGTEAAPETQLRGGEPRSG